MLRWLFILVWLLSCSVLYVERARPVFGVKISIGPNSQTTSYVCYLDNGRVLTQQRIVDRETFVKFVSGYWPSVYNPERQNLFKEHGIECDVFKDDLTRQTSVNCIPLDSLWKLRFACYPFRGNGELGWSNKYHKPSPGQEVYLAERYNVQHIDGDYFMDENFWRLLQDVMDPQWIAGYKAIR